MLCREALTSSSSFFPAQPHGRRLDGRVSDCNVRDKVNYWASNMFARCQIAFYTFHLPRLSDRTLLLGALGLSHARGRGEGGPSIRRSSELFSSSLETIHTISNSCASN